MWVERAQLATRLSQAAADEQALRSRLAQAEQDREQAAMQALSSSELLGKVKKTATFLPLMTLFLCDPFEISSL